MPVLSVKNRVKGKVLLIIAGAMLLSGCVSAGSGSAGHEEIIMETSEREAQSTGRYIETMYELPGEVNRYSGIFMMDDGTMQLYDYQNGPYCSTDEGKTWKKKEAPWMEELEDLFYRSASIAPDGTIALLGTDVIIPDAADSMDETKEALSEQSDSKKGKDEEVLTEDEPEQEDSGEWISITRYFLIDPEGNLKEIPNVAGTDSEESLCALWFAPDGTLTGTDYNGKAVEVDPVTGKQTLLFEADTQIQYVTFSENRMMAVTTDRVWFYDREQGMLSESDPVIDKFISKNKNYGYGNTDNSFPLLLTPGDTADTIYIADNTGLYRHALGGSVMEQIVNGSLSTFGDTMFHMVGMTPLSDGDFLVMYTGMAVRCHYDETMPVTPEKELNVYSLTENYTLRQGISIYRRKNPNVHIKYEVGMDSENGVTGEDAVKSLNTRILAGNGPDLLLLDGLPVKSYTEKGILTDLKPLLSRMTGKDELLPGIMTAFEKEGSIYQIPSGFHVSVIFGDRNVIENITDLSGLADQMEILRQEQSQGGILGIYNAGQLLNILQGVSAYAWVNEDGGIETEKIREFLSQAKRIYDVEAVGITEEDLLEHQRKEEEAMTYYGLNIADYQPSLQEGITNILRGYSSLGTGSIQSISLNFDLLTSAMMVDDNLDFKMFGEAGGGFTPNSLLGISSKAKDADMAGDLLQQLLGYENQSSSSGAGFAVNRQALEESLAEYTDGEYYSSMGLPARSGEFITFRISNPTQEDMSRLGDMIDGLHTPYQSDTKITEEVMAAGIKVLEGRISLEEGIAEIEKNAAIYLAE